MIGTEFLYGFGLGNQLFWYVAARALAKEKGYEFGICNPKALANNMHSNSGMYFMDIDLGNTRFLRTMITDCILAIHPMIWNTGPM